MGASCCFDSNFALAEGALLGGRSCRSCRFVLLAQTHQLIDAFQEQEEETGPDQPTEIGVVLNGKLQAIPNHQPTRTLHFLGIEENVVKESDKFTCTGSLTISGRRIKCWRHYRPHGEETFAQGVNESKKHIQNHEPAIFIVDEKDVVRYVQIVDEVTSEPNYDEVLNTLKSL